MSSLLERQTALAAYLTDPVCFGRGEGLPSVDAGIDPKALARVGEMVLQKRTAKIRAVLPKTTAYLRDEFAALAREFAHRCAPSSTSSFENARQFYAFLEERHTPTRCLDLCRVELAIANVLRSEDAHPYLGDVRLMSPTSWRIVARYETVICETNVRLALDRSEIDEKLERSFVVVWVPACGTGLRAAMVSPALLAFLAAVKSGRDFPDMASEPLAKAAEKMALIEACS